MNRYYYSYNEFIKDIKNLAFEVKSFNPEAIVAISRGGLTITHFLGLILNIREIVTINSIYYEKDKKLDKVKVFNIPSLSNKKRVLIVDDIVDSGDTLKEVKKILTANYSEATFKVATIFFKKSALIKPDFKIKEAKEWIDFFWEVDIN